MTLFLVTHIVRSGPKRYRAEFNLKMKDTKQIFPPTLKLLKIILSCILSCQFYFDIKLHSGVFNYLLLSVIDRSCLLRSVPHPIPCYQTSDCSLTVRNVGVSFSPHLC